MSRVNRFHTKNVGVLVAIFLALTVTLPAEATPRGDAPIDERTLTQLANDHFAQSAEIMVEGHVAVQEPYRTRTLDAATSTVGDVDFSLAVDRYREELASLGERYSSSRTETAIDSIVSKTTTEIKLIATETTFLTIEGSGTETGFSAKHEMTFSQNSKGVWELTSDEFLEPTGLLPLSEAESLVKEDSEYFTHTIGSANFSDLTPAATHRPVTVDAHDKIATRGGYNYTAMANYLERYWNNYNPAYRSFSGSGGDCTNFVSQALRAGGWEFKSGWYRNANYWWYNWSNQSRSWTAVEYWATFARNSGRTSMLSNVWQLRKGDVLQVKPRGSNQKVHTMMVSYFNNNVPYFTYHSRNRYRRSLNQVLIDWKGATFYAYRT